MGCALITTVNFLSAETEWQFLIQLSTPMTQMFRTRGCCGILSIRASLARGGNHRCFTTTLASVSRTTYSETARRLYAEDLHPSVMTCPSTMSEGRQALHRGPSRPMTTTFRGTVPLRALSRPQEEELTDPRSVRSNEETTELRTRTTGMSALAKLFLGGQCSRFPTLATRAITCCSTVQTANSAMLTATCRELTSQ